MWVNPAGIVSAKYCWFNFTLGWLSDITIGLAPSIYSSFYTTPTSVRLRRSFNLGGQTPEQNLKKNLLFIAFARYAWIFWVCGYHIVVHSSGSGSSGSLSCIILWWLLTHITTVQLVRLGFDWSVMSRSHLRKSRPHGTYWLTLHELTESNKTNTALRRDTTSEVSIINQEVLWLSVAKAPGTFQKRSLFTKQGKGAWVS